MEKFVKVKGKFYKTKGLSFEAFLKLFPKKNAEDYTKLTGHEVKEVNSEKKTNTVTKRKNTKKSKDSRLDN